MMGIPIWLITDAEIREMIYKLEHGENLIEENDDGEENEIHN